jgi:PAS domain S-box-containing protein
MIAKPRPYKLLIVEDNEGDFILIREYLEDHRPIPELFHAKSYKEFLSVINEQNDLDTILLDLTLPDASGEKLIKDVVENAGSIPVIILTGFRNQEFGVKALSMGITDYLQKDDLNPYLLIKSITYSIERHNFTQSLKESEKQFRDLFDFNPLPMWVYDLSTLKFLNVNAAAIRNYGYSRDEFLSMTIEQIRPKDQIPILHKALEANKIENRGYTSGIYKHKTKNGQVIDVEIQGNIIDFYGIRAELILAIDITDKIRKEASIRESLDKFDIVSKATSDVIWDLDLVENKIRYNQAFKNVFGYEIENMEYTRDWWSKNIHPDDYDKFLVGIHDILQSGDKRIQIEYRFLCSDGTYKYVNDRAFVVMDKHNKPIRVIGAMQDITKKKEEENRLKLFESVIKNSNDAVTIAENTNDPDFPRKIIFVNKAFTDITGYSLKDVLGKPTGIISGEKTDKKELQRLHENILKLQPTVVELLNYKKSGETFWVNQTILPILNQKDECTHWISIKRDITESKNYEKTILKSLKEKETLLSEIHHRVKNNLAIVSGLIHLQTFQDDDQLLKNKLLDSASRIQTIALIHEHLYKSNSFSKIDFPANMKTLIDNIIETFKVTTVIKLNYACDPVFLNINQAIPCSLIVNEIITNTLKHAFVNSDKGEIDVRISVENDIMHLRISDNGVGMPENLDYSSGETLGLLLVKMLTEQLLGKYKFEANNPGTTFLFTFELNPDLKGSASTLI